MANSTFIEGPFRRSHGKAPRGYGSWAFSQSASADGLASDLIGPVQFFNGAFADAKKQAREFFVNAEFVAVLP